MVITLENTCNTSDGNYIYGGYEELVPILEVLGADGIMSSVEYTEYVNAGANSDEKMDRRIRGILVPVFNLIDTIASAESPLTEVVKLLPKVAYAVDSGILNTQIQRLIGKLGMGLGSSINVDLTTEGLYNILAPKLKDIKLQAAKTDENGEETAPAVTLSIRTSSLPLSRISPAAAFTPQTRASHEARTGLSASTATRQTHLSFCSDISTPSSLPRATQQL